MITIPTRLDLMRMLPEGALVAEVGVCKGHFSVAILNSCPIGKLFLVDAWKYIPGYEDAISQAAHDANLKECAYHIAGHLPGQRVEIVRGLSIEVAQSGHLPPLDGVYIDADHTREACRADLNAWMKCLKPGGCLMGHDYVPPDKDPNTARWGFGVIAAVDDFCREHGWVITHLTADDFPSYRLEKAAPA